jgi:hypothetical protein
VLLLDLAFKQSADSFYPHRPYCRMNSCTQMAHRVAQQCRVGPETFSSFPLSVSNPPRGQRDASMNGQCATFVDVHGYPRMGIFRIADAMSSTLFSKAKCPVFRNFTVASGRSRLNASCARHGGFVLVHAGGPERLEHRGSRKQIIGSQHRSVRACLTRAMRSSPRRMARPQQTKEGRGGRFQRCKANTRRTC